MRSSSATVAAMRLITVATSSSSSSSLSSFSATQSRRLISNRSLILSSSSSSVPPPSSTPSSTPPAAPVTPASTLSSSFFAAPSSSAAAAVLSSANAARVAAIEAHNAKTRKITSSTSGAELRRIYREEVANYKEERDLMPWETKEQEATVWTPKYADDRAFYYSSAASNDATSNLTGPVLRRYLGTYGRRYLLSKHLLPSGAALPSIDMSNRKQLHVELNIDNGPLNYWYLHLQTGQRPRTIVDTELESTRIKSKAKQMLKVNLSKPNVSEYLMNLNDLWPRKDERDIEWQTHPRRDHGQYRIILHRVLAEGPSKPLNAATASFIDHIKYQLVFHFKEDTKQNRNMHWMQFLGIPGLKVSKRWGGELKIPQMRVLDE